ncbi:hypothetical protein HY491_04000 [Candidatus Woesearchaeota archaeon]|nr:hypothetical protein [Candidatus Woesearchaeota archaeon]
MILPLSRTIDFLTDLRSMCRRARMSDEETEREFLVIDQLLHKALFNPSEDQREQAMSMLDAVCGYAVRKAFVGDNQIMVEILDRKGEWRLAYAGEAPLVYEGRIVEEAYPFILRRYRREPADF